MTATAGIIPSEKTRPKFGWLRPLTVWHGLVLGCFVFFAWAVAQFYQPATGFSSLIMIGDALNQTNPPVTALREVRHYVYEQSYGYDGAYYVQLALYPTLENPELAKAIDNLPYRARRILFSWVAWLLGLGQPAWIVQAHALLNVGCWFLLGWLLLRWFPPNSGQNFIRWAGVMFSQGVCMSVRLSLVDLPTLLLVVWAVRCVEERKTIAGGVTLALVGLGKETDLLASAALWHGPWRSSRTWLRWFGQLALIVLPLGLWMAYIRWKFGPTGEVGLNNFTVPLAGLIEKWSVTLASWLAHPAGDAQLGTLLMLLAVTLQVAFVLARWQPENAWWRIGAVYAGLAIFLAQPVWEGFPGAFGRVLLPLCVAFNVLVPRSRRWLPILLAGNLAVLSAWREYTPPEKDFLELRGPKNLVSRLEVSTQTGWYGPENSVHERWRWTSGEASLLVRNISNEPVRAIFHGQVSALDPQRAEILVGPESVWTGGTGPEPVAFEFSRALPPGDTVLRFKGEKPPRRVTNDPRLMGLSIYNLDIAVAPAGPR